MITKQFLFFLSFLFLYTSHSHALLTPANNWKLTIQQAELFNRNQNIGEPIEMNMDFVQWIDVDDSLTDVRSTIGLTKSGRLFHLVEFIGQHDQPIRRVVRLLSGFRTIQSFYKTETGHILAVDTQNHVLIFDPELWAQSPMQRLIKSGLGVWGLSSLALLAGSFAFNHEAILQNPAAYSILATVTSFGLAINTALMNAFKYNILNENPDGFRETNVTFENENQLSSAWSSIKSSLNLSSSHGSWRISCQNSFLPQLSRELRISVHE